MVLFKPLYQYLNYCLSTDRMVQVKRFELLSDAYKTTRLTVDLNLHMAPPSGVEPESKDFQSSA